MIMSIRQIILGLISLTSLSVIVFYLFGLDWNENDLWGGVKPTISLQITMILSAYEFIQAGKRNKARRGQSDSKPISFREEVNVFFR